MMETEEVSETPNIISTLTTADRPRRLQRYNYVLVFLLLHMKARMVPLIRFKIAYFHNFSYSSLIIAAIWSYIY
jgi:hypothetical protein